jgi:hypothetical protein
MGAAPHLRWFTLAMVLTIAAASPAAGQQPVGPDPAPAQGTSAPRPDPAPTPIVRPRPTVPRTTSTGTTTAPSTAGTPRPARRHATRAAPQLAINGPPAFPRDVAPLPAADARDHAQTRRLAIAGLALLLLCLASATMLAVTVRAAAMLAVIGIVTLPAPSAVAATVDWTAFGTTGANGWYRSDVWINWTVANVAPPLQQTCEPVHLVNDTAGRQASCTVIDASGTATKTTTAIRIDQTPPTATGTTSRPPDADGWFNHPVDVAFSGSDATSGLAACSGSTYAGPDGPSAQATGSCRDNAGNVAAVALSLNYDATPPSIIGVTAARRPDVVGWYLAPVAIAWAGTDAVSGLAGCTATTYAGPDGRSRSALGTCADQAGNTSAPLPFSLRYGPPQLSWRAREAARYYNVQLFRNGRKVLSAWPRAERYQLRRSWRYGHRRHRLAAGRYRWYVWPGYGPRAQRRYGRIAAKGSFAIR